MPEPISRTAKKRAGGQVDRLLDRKTNAEFTASRRDSLDATATNPPQARREHGIEPNSATEKSESDVSQKMRRSGDV